MKKEYMSETEERLAFLRLSPKEKYDKMKKEYPLYFHQGVTKYGWIVGDFNCGCKYCKI